MLWAYLDDSAVAGFNQNRPRRYALGGGIAQKKVWAEIRCRWQARLRHSGNPSKINWFHYKDWKRAYLGHSKTGQSFYGWSRPQLEILLGDLTEIISERKVDYLCASVLAVGSRRPQRDSYKCAVEYILTRSEQIRRWVRQPDQFSFMFSRHTELSSTRIQRYFEMLRRAHPFLQYCVVTDPRLEPLLQVADLIVNEMATSRFIRASFGPQFILPVMTRMMQLLKREPPFHHMVEFHPNDDWGERQ